LQNLKPFIDDFSKALRENNAAIFAGAGLSSGAGFVNWTELLRSVAEELHLKVDVVLYTKFPGRLQNLAA